MQNISMRNVRCCCYEIDISSECSRDTKDKASLEYVREMNRKRFAETGEYMTKVISEQAMQSHTLNYDCAFSISSDMQAE